MIKLYEMYMREEHSTVRSSLLQTLIKARNWNIIDRLFKTVERNRKTKADLIRLVKACGDNKITESVPHLGKILFRRVFFNSSATDELKIAAIVSLGQIRTPESVELVRKGLGVRRETLKKMSEIVLRMAESGGKTA
jgi:hypothetical protein